ncbi:hypothetical protein D9M73_220180 [compost metagenome]
MRAKPLTASANTAWPVYELYAPISIALRALLSWVSTSSSSGSDWKSALRTISPTLEPSLRWVTTNAIEPSPSLERLMVKSRSTVVPKSPVLLTRNAPVTGWRTAMLAPQVKFDGAARPLAASSARGWTSSLTSATSTTSAPLLAT